MDEGKIAWEEYAPDNRGDIVLMAPGIGDLQQEYRLLAPLLAAQGMRPITLDLRGMGASSVGWHAYLPEAVGRDMLALARHLGDAPVWLAGCSMAAASAVWAAVEAPALVKGVILLGPSLEDMTLTAIQQFGLAVGMSGPWKVRFWEAFYRSLYPSAKPADFDDYCAKLRANLNEPQRFASVKAFLGASKAACSERMPALARPALVIMGERDPDYANPADQAQKYAAALRGKASIMPGSGHYPHVDAPAQTAQIMLAWMQEQ